MATHYRLLRGAGTPVAENEHSDPMDVVDLGGARFAGFEFNVLATAGTGQKIIIQHAAVNDDAYFIDLTGVEAALNQAGPSYVGTDDFLRFIRWRVEDGLGGTAKVVIDVIAKEA